MKVQYWCFLLVTMFIVFFVFLVSSAAAEMKIAVVSHVKNTAMTTIEECIGQEIVELQGKTKLRVISNDGKDVAYVELVKTGKSICVQINNRLKKQYGKSLARTRLHKIKPLDEANFAKGAPKPIRGSNYAINLNPGGLRGSRGPFTYASLEEGVRAMDELLGRYYFSNPRYNTINKYVARYVGPVGRRKIEQYKRNISAWSGVPRDQVIAVDDRETRNRLLAAALRQESGGDWNRYIAILFDEPKRVAETEE